jgi:hypothetical protein
VISAGFGVVAGVELRRDTDKGFVILFNGRRCVPADEDTPVEPA